MNRFVQSCLTFLTILLFMLSPTDFKAEAYETESVIVEVEGDAHQHKAYIEKNYPLIEVITVYDTLFQGLALQGRPKELEKLESADFIKGLHSVRTYEAFTKPVNWKTEENVVYPNDLNTTGYTGKGVKIGVIDTGIDYDHPDLQKNYHGGYDLVDLDDDPMETLPEEGIPTLHGSHVAGIIAADGELKGVAPDAEVYAYRALGPGGMGTSVQVIAAMEQAVKDGMDVMNLSLGNAVNGPDYPTSKAVNKAVDLGVAVVIANGNSGPEHWTVGAPATASKALAVGAASTREQLPYLYDGKTDKRILLKRLPGSIPWNLDKTYPVTAESVYSNQVSGKIVLIRRSGESLYEQARIAEQNGAVGVVAFHAPEEVEEYMENSPEPLSIPIAQVSSDAGAWLIQKQAAEPYPMETVYEEIDTKAATFSSRGPVTVNWQIKPDVLAPGTNILSTIPGGYQALQGTSMAAPHAAGVIALMKEAHPDWPVEKIFSALKTTATRAEADDGTPLAPIVQGMGNVNPKEAIGTGTIIYDPLLSFGKLDQDKNTAEIDITIENTTNNEQTYYFQMPKKERGIRFQFPQQFTVEPHDKKTISIKIDISGLQLDEGIHQGWITLQNQQESKPYHLPYLFVHESAENPKAMGFEFTIQPFSDDMYVSRLYLAEPTRKVTVDLYDPDTLMHDRKLFEIENAGQGLNEVEISREEVGEPGFYIAVITVYLEDGSYENIETHLFIQ